MAFGNCSCPNPTELEGIPVFTCGEDLQQVQKLAIMRRQDSDSPPFANVTAIQTLANWTTLLNADDDTKVVVTPFIEAFVIPGGEPILEGGDDNSTLDGAPVAVGATTPRASGMMRSIPASVRSVLKQLNCESDLVVFMINESGKIIGQTAENGTGVEGIPITSFFVGDPGNEGKNTNDKTPISFSLRYGWADRLKFATPSDFNARYDLKITDS